MTTTRQPSASGAEVANMQSGQRSRTMPARSGRELYKPIVCRIVVRGASVYTHSPRDEIYQKTESDCNGNCAPHDEALRQIAKADLVLAGWDVDREKRTICARGADAPAVDVRAPAR